MPKPKQYLKKPRKASKNDKTPKTADEFLEAGVDFEEAGEKWRAGDAAKSNRFFLRAIDNYEAGLRQFPESFDLAYNKARVQYQITQHPTLAGQLPTPLVGLLQIALESHRYALNLNQDNADVLFNTAQVLTSGAEAISGGRRSSEESRQNALQMLQEALELFQRCLTVQELQFTESQERMEMTDDTSSSPGIGDDEDTSGIRDGSEGIVDDRWASVVEPVTKDSLVDTAVAQLETLTTACGLLTSDAGSGLAWIEEYSNNLLQGKIATYVAGTNRHHEVSLARANFICALADTCYRTGRIDLQTYEKEIASAFGPYLDLSQDPQGLCDKADALIAFISAIYESISASTEQNPHQLTLLNALLWNHLTMASTSLSSAAKLPTTHKLAKIHIARGDVELFRFRLGEAPLFHAVAKKHAKTLLKNAEVYFRGAAGIAKSEGSVDEEREATIKLAIAGTIVGDHSNILTLLAKENKEILAVVEDMVEDGIVGKEWLERFGGG